MYNPLFVSLPDVEESAGITSSKLEKQILTMGINVFAKIDGGRGNILSMGKRCSLSPMIIARSLPILQHYAQIPEDVIKTNTFGETWTLDTLWARKKAFTEDTEPSNNPKNYAVITSDFEQTYPDDLEDFAVIAKMYLDPDAKRKIEFLSPIRVGYRSLYIHKKDLKRLSANKSYDELTEELDKVNKQLTHYKKQASSQFSLPEGTNPKLILACQLNDNPELDDFSQEAIADFIEANYQNIKRTTAEEIAKVVGKRTRGQRGKTKLTR